MALDDRKKVQNYYFGNFEYYYLTLEMSNLCSCYKTNTA